MRELIIEYPILGYILIGISIATIIAINKPKQR